MLPTQEQAASFTAVCETLAKQYRRGCITGMEVRSEIERNLQLLLIMDEVPPVDTVERLIDKHGINGLLDAVAEVTAAKEEHVTSNWQDAELGKYWRYVNSRVNGVVLSLCKRYRAAVTGPF